MAGRASRAQAKQTAIVFSVAKMQKPSFMNMKVYLEKRTASAPQDDGHAILLAMLTIEKINHVKR